MYLFLCSDSTEAAAPKSVDDLCRSRHNSREISELPTEAGSVHQRFGYGFFAVARVNVLSLYIAQPSFVWRATRPTQGLQAIFNQWMKVVKYRFSSRPTRNHHRPMTFSTLFSFWSPAQRRNFFYHSSSYHYAIKKGKSSTARVLSVSPFADSLSILASSANLGDANRDYIEEGGEKRSANHLNMFYWPRSSFKGGGGMWNEPRDGPANHK